MYFNFPFKKIGFKDVNFKGIYQKKMNLLNTTFKDLFYSLKWWQFLGIVFLFSFALYVRVTNLYHLGFVFDTVTTQYTWGQAALDLGYGSFWESYPGFFDYLPGSLIFIMLVAAISKIFDPIIPGNGEYSFVFILKFLNSVADLAFTIILYLIARRIIKLNKGNAMLLSAFVYALPSLWFISSVWGQFDTLVVLFGVASILLYYKSLYQKRTTFWKSYAFWSGVMFSLGFWMKSTILILLPPLFILYFGGKTSNFIKETIIKAFLWLLKLGAILAIGVFLYLYSDNYYYATILILGLFFGFTLYKSYKLIQKDSNEGKEIYLQGFGFWLASWIIATVPIIYNPALVFYNLGSFLTKPNNITNGASTFWPLIGMTGVGSDKLIDINGFGPSVNLVGITVYVVSMILLYLKFSGFRLLEIKKSNYKIDAVLDKLFNKRLELVDLIIFITINSGIFFMFMTKMHSRYLIWSILFSLLAFVLLIGKRRWKLWFTAILLIHFGYFLNQLGVYNNWYHVPSWTHTLAEVFKFNIGSASSLFNLIGLFSMYLLAWFRFTESDRITVNNL